MKGAIVFLLAQMLSVAVAYPVMTTGSTLETCEGISCAAVECKPPFKYQSPEETGTCCPLCFAKEIDVPEDRSWAKGMTGGIGMDNNADPIACRDVVCVKPDCEEFNQVFSGSCCTVCK
mmetsp:Transcript_26765/g.79826  ORF Transcript_26765/g.79826 Transcript_26765/m.79826 type:complete len:119 (-) Transcript_26765:65-421(-)